MTISFLSVSLFVFARAVMRASRGARADSSTEGFLLLLNEKAPRKR